MQDAEVARPAPDVASQTATDLAPQPDRAPDTDGSNPAPASPPKQARRFKTRFARRHRFRRFSLTVVLALVVLGLGFAFLTLAYTGKSVRIPVWAVAELETRLNAGLTGARLPPGTSLALGSVELGVDRSFVPSFRLADIRLVQASGRALLTLPEAEVSFDPNALLSGKVRPSTLRLIGTRLAVRRDADGRIDLAFGTIAGGNAPKSAAELLDAANAILSAPALSSLARIEAEGLTLTLSDARSGRAWDVGDGRLLIDIRPDEAAAELGMTLLEGAVPAQATISLVSSRTSRSARVTATVDKVDAADIAAFSPPLAWLGFVRAPISGRFAAEIGADGKVADLGAELRLGQGALEPGPDARPIAFEAAEMTLGYDPAAARITLSRLSVESASLRLSATGQTDLLAADGSPVAPGALPDAFLGQIAFSKVMVDPEGLFEEPIRFSQGALDVRLRLNPFRLDIGQLALVEENERLNLSGSITAADGGWSGGLDVTLDRIGTDRLLKLWPVSAVPRTRAWLEANVGQGTLNDVTAALRLAPGQPPRFSLGYEFADTEVRFVKTLPPIRDGTGHATLENNTYTVFLDKGHVIAPEGGRIEADGSVFQVPDITQKPAVAKVSLVTRSDLTAALSLLDQDPFNFLSKAGQPVNLGVGLADLTAELTLPLKPRVTFPEITYTVSGKVRDFKSTAIVPGRVLAAPEVDVAVNTEGLQLSGRGTLGKLPIDVTYVQGFGPEQKGRARVNGSVTLSDLALRDLGIDLPQGTLKGEAPAAIDVDLRKDEQPRLTLTSTLAGMTLSLPALSFTKPAKTRAALDLEATLGRSPTVDRMTLSAPGLTATGRITTREGGGLDTARFSSVQAGDWLDAEVVLTGAGRGNAVDIAVTGGSLDIRKLPGGDGGLDAGGGSPLALRLDRLIVSDGISFTDFRGAFGQNGGLNGRFSASVNGQGAVNGAVAPAAGGTAIRITSDNAGTVMAAAGIFDKGRGGTLDMTLVPRGPAGHYDGRATFSRLRVQDAPGLAELLSAISVVGLLEQLNGEGLAFNNGEMNFILTPDAVEITQGSAVGASLGISFAGLYRSAGKELALQGVISPIYLVNGIGAIFSRRGEGMFGFNYSLTGTADDPVVSVNPLSIFTPGMFREIFRSAPPKIEDSGG